MIFMANRAIQPKERIKSTMNAAFNYDTQEWVVGKEADAERKRQVSEELALLRGPRGEQYAKFCGGDCPDREAMIARLEMELAGLEGAL